MALPFTVSDFFDTFRRYNDAIWPLQWALTALGVAAVALAARGGAHAGRRVSAILAVLWLWTGLVYHLAFFRAINPAAIAFAGACVVQAALFLWIGVALRGLEFRPGKSVSGVAGWVLAVYALAVYPLVGAALGRHYPAAPTFGAPCPTAILTLALLTWGGPALPRAVLVVPVAWSVVATSAALQLGVVEDLGLPAAALVATLAAAARRRVTAPALGA